MLNPFGDKAKLTRAVEHLCILNDKGWGVDLSKPEAIEKERDRAMSKIMNLIEAVGESALPKSFILAVESGEIREELEGMFLDELKAHFKKS